MKLAIRSFFIGCVFLIAPTGFFKAEPPVVTSTTSTTPVKATAPVAVSTTSVSTAPVSVSTSPALDKDLETDDKSDENLPYDPTRRLRKVGFDGAVAKVVVQSDGKLLVAGNFSRYYEDPCGDGITRLKSNGLLDRAFATNAAALFYDAFFSSILVMPDGKIVLGGAYKKDLSGESSSIKGLVRLLPNGQIDPTFPRVPNGDIKGVIQTMVLQPDGKILVGGAFVYLNGHFAGGFARLENDGRFDTAFSSAAGPGVGVEGSVQSIMVQPDGKIVVAGQFRKFSGKDVNGIIRLNSDGSVDQEFLDNSTQSFFPGFDIEETSSKPSDSDVFLPAILLEPDGKILMAGEFVMKDEKNVIYASRVIRLDDKGILDLGFVKNLLVHDFLEDVNSLELQNDRILVGSVYPFSRLSNEGKHDEKFLATTGYSIKGAINTIVVHKKGKIVIAGEFPAIKGVLVGNIARLNSDGTLDEDFIRINY